jgi:hypothetical protein
MLKLPGPKKYMHAKFRIHKRFNAMDAFFISENKERIDEWTAQKEDEPPQKTVPTATENTFAAISRAFERSMEEFQETVPFLMAMMPIITQLSDDRTVRGFVRQHGDLINKDTEFETYRIGVDHIGEITRRLQKINCIHSGISSLPSMFLVGLISAYDVFLSNLIRIIFTVRPELLSSSERNISLKDLIEFDSVEAARECIIEKEVETVIRKSHPDQITWLSATLKMTLTKDLTIWPEFVELCERRNLLTHTGGIVSAQYLKVCRDHGYPVENAQIGQKLAVTATYYRKAVQIVLEFGMKLIQVVWRKLVETDINTADRELNVFGYRLITRRRYKAAATMLRFGLYEMKKHGSDAVRKMMVVNYANAVKLGGDKVQAEQILDAEDWSASTDDYRICVAAVKGETTTVIRMMKSVVASGIMQIQYFRDWPVFETIRSDPEFAIAFEEQFDEKLMVDKEAKMTDATSDDEVDPTETESSPSSIDTIH